jgi:hypothetical protein
MIIVYSKSEYLKEGDKSVDLNVGGIIILKPILRKQGERV